MSADETQLALGGTAQTAHEPPSFRTLRAVPLRLAVTIPVPGLKLRDLRALRVGHVFATLVPAADDVPVRVGGTLLGWAELDSADGRMAVRLTRLS